MWTSLAKSRQVSIKVQRAAAYKFNHPSLVNYGDNRLCCFPHLWREKKAENNTNGLYWHLDCAFRRNCYFLTFHSRNT